MSLDHTGKKPIDYKMYLGDSVYADFDGYYVRLYLNNGYGDKNEILMEPMVIDSLITYLRKLGYEIKD